MSTKYYSHNKPISDSETAKFVIHLTFKFVWLSIQNLLVPFMIRVSYKFSFFFSVKQTSHFCFNKFWICFAQYKKAKKLLSSSVWLFYSIDSLHFFLLLFMWFHLNLLSQTFQIVTEEIILKFYLVPSILYQAFGWYDLKNPPLFLPFYQTLIFGLLWTCTI